MGLDGRRYVDDIREAKKKFKDSLVADKQVFSENVKKAIGDSNERFKLKIPKL